MSWLTRVRNALPFAPKRETPDNLWVKCPGCSEMLFTREFEENLYVCPRCEYHGRIGADTRLGQILDPGYELLPAPELLLLRHETHLSTPLAPTTRERLLRWMTQDHPVKPSAP